MQKNTFEFNKFHANFSKANHVFCNVIDNSPLALT